jgi:hypothetical protein
MYQDSPFRKKNHFPDPQDMPGGVALLELQAQDLGVGGRPISWPLDHYPLFEQVELPTRVEGFNSK